MNIGLNEPLVIKIDLEIKQVFQTSASTNNAKKYNKYRNEFSTH
jgi:hypothetical protein